MINFFNTKSKVIALITGAVVVAGGVAFGFRDQFLSDKSLYMKIEEKNIEMIADKFEEIKEEDLLGMFFSDSSNRAVTKTDIALNISAKEGMAGDVANFFNSLKLSIKDDIIQKEEYKNKKIAFSYKEDELIDLNIVNDEKTVGVSVPKLYDKWIVSDMSIAEVISEIVKSDEGTGTTNTMSVSEIKSVFELSKTEKQDVQNALAYHLDKIEKTLNDVTFTKVLDATCVYDDNKNVVSDSIKLELSEVETLARLSQILTKVKESGQLLDLFYNKVADIKQSHGQNNILTDCIPEKKEALNKINGWLESIDKRLLELGITDISVLFDKDDKYIGVEGIEDSYYAMVIYYENDYKILKRELYIPGNGDVLTPDYEIVCIENEDANFYRVKTPNQIFEDNVQIDNGISTHNFTKSYYKESYSFEGFKLNKVQKWIDAEEFLKVTINSQRDNQKTILVQMPSIKSFSLFVDINKEELGRNEINVVTKVGLDIKGERQYIEIAKNVVKNAAVEKVDIYSNSININEETQEKLDMIAQVVKGNTSGLSKAIEEKTGIDLSETLKKLKDIPQKAIDTYKALNALGIIG